MMCAIISVEVAIAVGFSDFCGTSPVGHSALATVTHAMSELEHQGAGDEARLFYTNLTAHYLMPGGCHVPNPGSEPLDVLVAEASAIELRLRDAASHRDVSACVDIDRLRAAVSGLEASIPQVLGALGDANGCGGKGDVAKLFDEAAVTGLCQGVGLGMVRLVVWQAAAAAVLLLLSILLPGLWHAHHLPPPSLPTRRDVSRRCQLPRPWCSLRACLRSCRQAVAVCCYWLRGDQSRRREESDGAGLLEDDSAAARVVAPLPAPESDPMLQPPLGGEAGPVESIVGRASPSSSIVVEPLSTEAISMPQAYAPASAPASASAHGSWHGSRRPSKTTEPEPSEGLEPLISHVPTGVLQPLPHEQQLERQRTTGSDQNDEL